VQDEVLYLSGHALPDWINKVSEFDVVPGIFRVVRDELLETDQFLFMLAIRELGLHDSITLKVQERVLQVLGGVDTRTFEALQERIQDLPISPEAFAGFDTSGLRDIERERNVIIVAVEKTKFYFYKESADFIVGQETALNVLLENVQLLLRLSQALRQSVRLHIIGNIDGRGSKIYNQKLAQRRAEVVFIWLQSHGIEKDKLIIRPPAVIRFGKNEPNPSDRNVIFPDSRNGWIKVTNCKKYSCS